MYSLFLGVHKTYGHDEFRFDCFQLVLHGFHGYGGPRTVPSPDVVQLTALEHPIQALEDLCFLWDHCFGRIVESCQVIG